MKRLFGFAHLPLAALLLVGCSDCGDVPAGKDVPRYSIVIDPGHGGVGKGAPDDKWDRVSQKYLKHYSPGTRTRRLTEHELALQLARDVYYYLELTSTPAGWVKFERILRRFSPRRSFRRIHLHSYLSRKDGWNMRKGRRAQDANGPYRLYDYPHPTKKGVMLPGRISRINRRKPYLVLSLHLNPASGRSAGGMGAVLSPGYKTFNLVSNITLGNKPRRAFNRLRWRRTWMIGYGGWNRFESARADTWVYFHGYRTKKDGSVWRTGFRGYRHNMFTWRYADPPGWEHRARKHPQGSPYALTHRGFRPVGRFWTRERGRAENWRREGGPLGYGGDNHYASDELMRFAQYGVRVMRPARRKPGAMPKILKPFVSTYSLPTYTNAICAFLEIAHINRRRDVTLLTNKQDRGALARSLAAGIYSLFVGLKPPADRRYGPYRPRGRRINFGRYERLSGGNYFRAVVR